MADLMRQVEELEALRAMYPEDEGCLTLDAQAWTAAAAAVGHTTACETVQQHATLSGTIRLPEVLLQQQPVALRFQLPAGYPSAEPPLLSVECSANRTVHEQLSSVVREAAEAAVGTESLLLVLGALQEAAAEAAANEASNSTMANSPPDQQQPVAGQPEVVAAAQDSTCPNDVLQVLVWFHHIKSTEKRKHLVAWARELNCSGFSKPGFPGIVLLEGLARDVREYLARVRALQWQAMQIRAEQLVTCAACNEAAANAGQHDPQKQQMQQQDVGASAHRALGELQFIELPENGMSQLGQACKAAGLEDLFFAALKLGK